MRKASNGINQILKRNGKSLPIPQNVIISLLESLKHAQDQNTIKIDSIYKLTNAIHSTTNLVPPNPLPSVPLKNEPDFLTMESYLVNPENYAYFVNRLSVIGGSDVRNAVMNMLKFVLSDELASHYNWAGRGGPKHSFKLTILMRVISDSIRMAYSKLLPPDLNDKCIEQAVKDWLKLAPQRFSNKSNK